MLLEKKNIEVGAWLFRWRSYLPLIFLVVLFVAILDISRSDTFYTQSLSAWKLACLLISAFGLLVRAYTVGYAPAGTSGRNTERQEAQTLNSTGIYSITRNPLYIGNFFMMLGVVLFIQDWSIALIYVLVFWLYYERIILAEEDFLKNEFGETYLKYAERTPAVIPNFKSWIPPTLKFSFKNVLKREYSGFFGMITAFTALEVAGNFVARNRIEMGVFWQVLFIVGLLMYLTLRTLKKKTRILHVEGR